MSHTLNDEVWWAMKRYVQIPAHFRDQSVSAMHNHASILSIMVDALNAMYNLLFRPTSHTLGQLQAKHICIVMTTS